jgi:hypothetical protein
MTRRPTALRPAFAVASALALALALAPHAARGQEPGPVPPNFASLVGVVSDSIRGGPLVGAHVSIVGSSRHATTDMNGVFRIDSIVPGEHELIVTHPLLDTLGLQVVSQPFNFVGGERRELGAHTPTFAEVRAKACPRGGPAGGTAMVVGRVKHADSEAPAAGASVSLVFRDLGVADGVEKVRTGRTGADGIFAICGLPAVIAGNLQASFGAVTTADLPIKINDDAIATAILTVGGSGTADAVLHGRVMTVAGAPVGGAQVAVVGTSKLVETAGDGTFTLAGLPSGTQEAVARRIGYAMATKVVQLSTKAPGQVTIVLQDAQVLTTVHVVGKLEQGLDKLGFTARKKIGNGWFMTPEEIEAKHPEIATDVMRTTNGLRVLTEGTGRFLSTSREGGCVSMFIDHARFDQLQAGDLDDAVPAADLGAIEFYPSGASTPAEFSVPGGNCATLVIWTRTLLSGLKR